MRLPVLRPLLLVNRVGVVCRHQTRSFTAGTAPLSGTKKILDDSDPNTRKVKHDISDLPEKQLYPEYSQPEKGHVYDKKPFKYQCIAGKAYVWCSCGRSHRQVGRIGDFGGAPSPRTNPLFSYLITSPSAMARTRTNI